MLLLCNFVLLLLLFLISLCIHNDRWSTTTTWNSDSSNTTATQRSIYINCSIFLFWLFKLFHVVVIQLSLCIHNYRCNIAMFVVTTRTTTCCCCSSSSFFTLCKMNKITDEEHRRRTTTTTTATKIKKINLHVIVVVVILWIHSYNNNMISVTTTTCYTEQST